MHPHLSTCQTSNIRSCCVVCLREHESFGCRSVCLFVSPPGCPGCLCAVCFCNACGSHLTRASHRLADRCAPELLSLTKPRDSTPLSSQPQCNQKHEGEGGGVRSEKGRTHTQAQAKAKAKAQAQACVYTKQTQTKTHTHTHTYTHTCGHGDGKDDARPCKAHGVIKEPKGTRWQRGCRAARTRSDTEINRQEQTDRQTDKDTKSRTNTQKC